MQLQNLINGDTHGGAEIRAHRILLTANKYAVARLRNAQQRRRGQGALSLKRDWILRKRFSLKKTHWIVMNKNYLSIALF